MHHLMRLAGWRGGVAKSAVQVRCFSQFIGGGSSDSSSTVTTRTNETIVFQSNAKWPWYVGKGATAQVYTAAALCAQIAITMPETASQLEIVASVGPMASASAVLFFATKFWCEHFISSVAVCRTVGQRDEYLKVTVESIFAPKKFNVVPSDIRLVSKDDKGVLTLKIHRTTYWLDTSKAEKLESKSLDILLSGKPLLVRRDKNKKSK
ncbi:unnamed protein product [Aphanomyces euteiches]|uniref:Uncharacterized protein n=1 Tax=Aphanomyces euteiches TaxID=100861 RepID=A0A6G0WXH3_9STRA|nr:hypothetical protein Ae201684_010570 [Aphanomyces euteiches]KAH9129649.1 hypothetical protein AeMF1_000322 [Aphanomyces euteiches]KAH9145390.1 hypothetical protein AeRB84_010743 [Aphanomyces euteiches]KAH9164406.1 hypothetical protein LEN26_000041 [Aphanomyces euteiches]KAH9194762.1 hypothetical protein AeNC1_003248 [Aphanomyces euteiches]